MVMMHLKTFIRRPGNKSKYIKQIVKHVPAHFNTYYEPFIGSGALFLYLQPSQWVINDINKDIMQIWRVIRSNPKLLLKYFRETQIMMSSMTDEEKKSYGQNLTYSLSKQRYTVKRAALFLFLTYISYIGHIQRNHKFYFPGLDKKVDFHKLYCLSNSYRENLLGIQNFLKTSHGVVDNNDYKHVLLNVKENDFVFLDPPYVESHHYQLTYNIDEKLDVGFAGELLAEVKKLDDKGVKWLMTQPDTPYVRKIV